MRRDAGRRPQPWHDEARALKAQGLTYVQIAIELDLSRTAIAMLFSDGYHRRQRDSQARLKAAKQRAA